MNQIKKAYLDLSKSVIQNHDREQYKAFNKLCANLNIKDEKHKDIFFDYCFNSEAGEEAPVIINSYLLV